MSDLEKLFNEAFTEENERKVFEEKNRVKRVANNIAIFGDPDLKT